MAGEVGYERREGEAELGLGGPRREEGIEELIAQGKARVEAAEAARQDEEAARTRELEAEERRREIAVLAAARKVLPGCVWPYVGVYASPLGEAAVSLEVPGCTKVTLPVYRREGMWAPAAVFVVRVKPYVVDRTNELGEQEAAICWEGMKEQDLGVALWRAREAAKKEDDLKFELAERERFWEESRAREAEEARAWSERQEEAAEAATTNEEAELEGAGAAEAATTNEGGELEGAGAAEAATTNEEGELEGAGAAEAATTNVKIEPRGRCFKEEGMQGMDEGDVNALRVASAMGRVARRGKRAVRIAEAVMELVEAILEVEAGGTAEGR